MAYLPKLNPTVGGGLGGLPERRATGGGAVNSVRRSIIGQAVKGSLAYRNTTTGDTYSADPIEGMTQEANLVLTSKINQVAVAVAMFDDGKFVIAYSNASGVCIEIYNLDGTVAVSQIIVDALYVAGKRIVVKINPVDENIMIVYSGGTGGAIIRKALYTKTGTVVQAATNIMTGMGTANENGHLDFDFWSDGWWIMSVTEVTAGQFRTSIFNSATATSPVNNTTQYSNETIGRIHIKAILASNRTYAFTATQSGGQPSAAGRGFVFVWQYNGSSQTQVRKFLIGDIGSAASQNRLALCFNNLENELVGFQCDANSKVSMAPSKIFFSDTAQYTPSKQRALEDSTFTHFSASDAGGDRFLITFGGIGGNPIFAGILNATGDWIASPLLCFFGDTYSFEFVKSAATRTGRAVVCAPSGATILIKTFSHRNTVTETYKLKDEYPIKVADFNPHVDYAYLSAFNINATQSADKFVLTWQQAASRDITWAIYSSGGTLISGPIVNTAIVGTSLVYNHKALLLPNGNVALVASISSNLVLGIYDSSGVLQGSLITVASSLETPDAEVASNGNIFIAYRNNTSTFMGRAVYSQTGTLVAAAADFTSAAVSNTNTIKVTYSSTNNNFLVTFLTTGTGYFGLRTFDSSGAGISGNISFGSAVLGRSAVCANADGTYSCVFNNVSNILFYARVNANGTFANALSSLSLTLTVPMQNDFQLLPSTNSEVMFLGWCKDSQHINCFYISTSTGLPVTNKKSFGIGSSWVEKFYISAGENYIQYRSANNAGSFFVTTSPNGDKYIATAWGDTFRLSSALPSGDYVIDGVVNSDVINGTAEIITNGVATRGSYLPRVTPFIANTTGAKKIMASKNQIFVAS